MRPLAAIMGAQGLVGGKNEGVPPPPPPLPPWAAAASTGTPVVPLKAFPAHWAPKDRLCREASVPLLAQFSTLLTNRVLPCSPSTAARGDLTLTASAPHSPTGRLLGLAEGPRGAENVKDKRARNSRVAVEMVTVEEEEEFPGEEKGGMRGGREAVCVAVAVGKGEGEEEGVARSPVGEEVCEGVWGSEVARGEVEGR
jgi:hypothetical protein